MVHKYCLARKPNSMQTKSLKSKGTSTDRKRAKQMTTSSRSQLSITRQEQRVPNSSRICSHSKFKGAFQFQFWDQEEVRKMEVPSNSHRSIFLIPSVRATSRLQASWMRVNSSKLCSKLPFGFADALTVFSPNMKSQHY
jgi:hypothetical protein